MVSRSYLTEKPPPPSELNRYLNQQVIPAAIDAAGTVEAALEHLAQRTRRQPMAAVGLAMGAGFLLSVMTRRGHGLRAVRRKVVRASSVPGLRRLNFIL